MIKFNLKSKFKRSIYILRSKKVSKALRNIYLNNNIGIVDIGAGHRYLPVLLNFDGIAKIAMIDPNKSLNWAFSNFKKLVKFTENLYKFNFGISNKTSKIKYYVTKTVTGSTFIDVFKNKKLDDEYFGKKKYIIQQVYSFKEFIRNFFKYKIDVIKIDIEGYETRIMPSILKYSKPFLIEIETNLNSEVYPNSFNSINALMIKNNYKLITGIPIYHITQNSHANNAFISGDYDNPVSRSPIIQFECIYIKDKKNYNLKEVCILLGYGIIYEVEKILKKQKKKLSNKKIQLIKRFIKKFF